MKRQPMMMALMAGLAGAAMAGSAAASARPDDAALARYAAELVRRSYPAEGPGGAVLVARGDTVLFRQARGEADMDAHAPLTPASVFRIGSVTKQFAAAGLLTLVEAGEVALDDPLSKYVPGYPGGDGITVLQLLNYTAGIPNYTAIPGYMTGPIVRDLTTAQMIEVFRDRPADFEPGSQWAYSNSGYVLVGAVIEAASGEPWHAYLKRALFEPLGMTHTGWGGDPRFAAQQVRGYSVDGDAVVPMRPLSMTQPHAAGGLLSNVDDLLRWNRALHEGRVLRSETYGRMVTAVGKAADPGVGYGMGLFIDSVREQKVLVHGGGIFGFIASLNYLPESDLTIVVLENDDQDDDRRGGDSADVKARKLAAMALGNPYPDLVAVPVEASALQAAEAVYRFDGGVVRILRLVDGQLTAQRDAGRRAVLMPIAGDDFLYDDGFNRLKLVRDDAGAISGIRFFANGEGAGVVGLRSDEAPPSAPAAMALPRAALERLAGTYEGGGLTLAVRLEGEALTATLPDQDPVALRATAPTRFVVDESGATLEFSAGEGPAGEVVMRQGGREMALKRRG